MREAIVQEETELGLTAGTDTKLTSEQGSSGTAVVRRTVDTMADLWTVYTLVLMAVP